MGIETALFVGLTAFKAISAISAGNAEAKAISKNASAEAQSRIDQGNLASKEKAKEIRARAARQTTSFLNSGLTLDGTADVVIGETYSTGIEDLNQIRKNYDTSAQNVVNQGNYQAKAAVAQGRQEAISAITSSFAGGSMGSMFGTGAGGIGVDNWLGMGSLSKGASNMGGGFY